MQYDKDELLFMERKYTELRSITLVQRAWKTHFKVKTCPDKNTIKLLFLDSKKPVHFSIFVRPVIRSQSVPKRSKKPSKI